MCMHCWAPRPHPLYMRSLCLIPCAPPRTAGSEFIKVRSKEMLGPKSAKLEAQLRGISGPTLLSTSNKLALLDKLLVSRRHTLCTESAVGGAGMGMQRVRCMYQG